jgi:hypothetical protein
VATGDFNGDGRDDLIWRNDDGTVTNWLANASGGFSDNWDNFNTNAGSSWQIIGVGDFNGDGKDDLLWRANDGTVTNWLGSPGGGFTMNWDNFHIVDSADWQVAGIGDFNGDHRADILWRKNDGTITDWLGQANGAFADNWDVASQPLSLDYQIAGVGDFNGDGFSDILLRDTAGSLETWVGSANGDILSPTEKLWQDALANVSDFVEEIGAIVATASSDEGSGGGGGLTPLSGEYRMMFGPNFPNVYVDGVYENEFSRASDDGYTLSILFGGVFGSITQLNTAGTFVFQVNGIDLTADWHSGSPPPVNSGDIVVTGQRDAPTGYFQINPILNGFDFGDGYGGGGGAGAYSKPSPDWSIHNPGVQSALALAHADEAGVIRAIAAWGTIVAAALNAHIDPALLAAIALRETDFRNIDQANGLGRGWFQIDLGAHPSVTWAQAHDLTFAANYAANILATNMATLARDFPNFTHDQLLQATTASYNFGTGNISGNPATIDQGTTGNNYGSNVLNLAKAFVDPVTGRTPGT